MRRFHCPGAYFPLLTGEMRRGARRVRTNSHEQARYHRDSSFLRGYRFLILEGLGVTIAYTILLGLVAGLLRLSRTRQPS